MKPPMTSDSLTAPLSDTEVSELDELLQALPEDLDPLDVEMLDGFLTAILLQPEPVLPSAWRPFVFDAQGRETALWDDVATAQHAIDLIMRRHNELAAYIAAREPFDPVIFELEDDNGKTLTGKAAIAALEPWAEGFMNALAAFPGLLDQLQADDASAVALTGILRHLPADPEDASTESREFARDKASFDRDMPLADLDEAIDALVTSVMDIADITRPRRPAARDSPKVGRNDPCPCGSGRKFKHCHGASVH
jgi:uncharacterized protein